MRRDCTGLAIMGMLLFLASPAAAEEPLAEGGEAKAKAQKRTAARLLPSLAQRRERLPDLATLAPVGNALEVMESVAVADNARVGVGLFSVVGSTEKELVRRRTDPSLNVRTKDMRVGGVGFSLRF